ncbi:MAG: 1-acyl-sn-glycerol-3-phosphate acyltransferase [Gammaproteobacteria bacterium]|nr:1-acyl-sn-glycerol-3-phosphate acyltransferase [Gammaproteobacteria bacterium]
MLESFVGLIIRIINIAEFVLFTALMYLLSYLPMMHDSRIYFFLFRFWCRSFIRALGLRLILHQKNIRPIPEQFILVSNHPSAVEDIGVPALYAVHSLAKIEVKSWFIVGRINRVAGTLYVDREDPNSRQNTVDNMLSAVADGKNIALYPEGGCTGRRITQPFKRGAFELSIRSGVPLLPLLIYYQAQEDFEWQPPYTLVDKIWHFLTSQNKNVEIFQYDVIDPAQFKDKYEFSAYMEDFYQQKQTKYLE